MAVAFDLRHPDLAAQELREANLQLARLPDVTPAIKELIDAVADEMASYDVRQFEDDPWLLVAIERAALQAKVALDLDNEHAQRRAARAALDTLERLLMAVAERQPVAADRDANDVARWLVERLGVPARQLAPALGVHARTLQRWTTDESRPGSQEEAMLRSVAQVAAQLRHVLTGPGVLAWLTRPVPELDDTTPAAALQDETALPAVLAAARSLRAIAFA